MGIGLSIARGLLKLHNGRIWAESPGEGKGSTFTIALPLSQSRRGAQPFVDR
jgi:signal transduction histidine kinase